MIQKLAAVTAIIIAATAPAAAGTITPGYYQSNIFIVSSNDPNQACAEIGFVQGYTVAGFAVVHGAGKPMFISEMFTYTPKGASATEEVVFLDFTFHNFPQTITGPVPYDGTAEGSSPFTSGISMQWTGGTLNTIKSDQFKFKAANVTIKRGGTLLCTASFDAAFLATGF
jgi:hypothetical protein